MFEQLSHRETISTIVFIDIESRPLLGSHFTRGVRTINQPSKRGESMRYGWRARIGHIAPAILDTSGEEMRKLLPAGVLHVGLTISEPIQTLGAEQAAAAFVRMVDAGKRLAAEKVDVLICGGAPVALSKGSAGDAELADLLRRETRLPVVTANGAVVDGLRTLGARTVIAVSPFIDARNQEIKSFLEASGFTVAATKGLGLTKNIDFASQSPDAAFALAYGVARAHPEADAIYIACPRWPSVDIIAALEADTGKTVVAAPAAMVWGALKALRINDCKPGFGRLMESLRSSN
jgi:maleate cis-trans isomerase